MIISRTGTGSTTHLLSEKETQAPGNQGRAKIRFCESCNKEGAKAICGRCKKVVYCNRECQKAHYRAHKALCINTVNPPVSLNTLESTTSFLRFPHLYLDMLKVSVDARANAKVLLLGPGIRVPKELGETDPLLQDQIFCPQLFELMIVHPHANVTVMEKGGTVFDLLNQAFKEQKLSYPPTYAERTLQLNNFDGNKAGYEELGRLICNPDENYKPGTITFERRDIATEAVAKEFDVIVATKILRYIATDAEKNCKDDKGKVAAAVNVLSHCFSGLNATGKLFVDKQSMDFLMVSAKLNLDALLARVKEKLKLESDIQYELIPHDVRNQKDPQTGHHFLLTMATSTLGLKTETDDIYKFTFKRANLH